MVYGGVPIEPQTKILRAGVEILVATPGRLLDHVQQRTVNLGQVSILVLDEADRMLDMGFLPDIRKILALLPDQRQNLLFSATFDDEVRRLSATILHDPATVEVAPRNTAAEAVQPARLPGRPRPQGGAAASTCCGRTTCARCWCSRGPRSPPPGSRTRLDRAGLNAVAIHSDRSQPERTRALEGFKTGDVRVLVATDVAARGLDIEDLPVVVNFELPWNPQDYIHRIGRTGRAGATGEAISLVTMDEADLLRGVQRLLRRAIPWTVEDGFVPGAGHRAAFDRRAVRPRASRTASRPSQADPPPGVSREWPASLRLPGRLVPGRSSPLLGSGSGVVTPSGGPGRREVSTTAPGKKNPSMRSASTRSTV